MPGPKDGWRIGFSVGAIVVIALLLVQAGRSWQRVEMHITEVETTHWTEPEIRSMIDVRIYELLEHRLHTIETKLDKVIENQENGGSY